MSGLLSGIGIEQLTDTFVEIYQIPNLDVPTGHFLKSSISLEENGPPVQSIILADLPGVSTYYPAFGLLTPNTHYWVRIWIEDGSGNITSDASRWVITLPPGSFQASGNAYVSCGDPQEDVADRHVWQYHPNLQIAYGQSFASPIVKGGEVA